MIINTDIKNKKRENTIISRHFSNWIENSFERSNKYFKSHLEFTCGALCNKP